MEFLLAEENAIHGAQLADEIKQALGIDLGTDGDCVVSFAPPLTVSIPSHLVSRHKKAIQAIVSAHIPDPLYFPEDRARKEAIERLKADKKMADVVLALGL